MKIAYLIIIMLVTSFSLVESLEISDSLFKKDNNETLAENTTKIDLNSASLEEIQQLPLTEEQAIAIYEYRESISFFNSIYDLKNIKLIDQKTFLNIKPLVIINKVTSDDIISERREDLAYFLEQLASNEGYREGMSDEWEDYLISPLNINKLTFRELKNFPNVNTQDALAISRRVSGGDTISTYRDLRSTEGISFYAARNLKNYVKYTDKLTNKRLVTDAQFKMAYYPYEQSVRDMMTEPVIRYSPDSQTSAPNTVLSNYWGLLRTQNNITESMYKIRVRTGNNFKAALMYYSPSYFVSTNAKELNLANTKYYVEYKNKFESKFDYKIIAGNYMAAFGEGLVMENSDYFIPRKTGYGYNKKITGVIGDISRTDEYALRGIALDLNYSFINTVLFFSKDDKNAIIYDSNDNGIIDKKDKVFSYYSPSVRLTNKQLLETETFFNEYPDNANYISIAPRIDYLNEELIGTHLSLSPMLGTEIGFTAYNSKYNKEIEIPDVIAIKNLLSLDSETINEKWKIVDSEISSLYSTYSEKYGYNRNFRRVYGYDFQTTIDVLSLQGEFAELEVDGDFNKIGDDPQAIILSAYTQFENFNFLIHYRNYDLEFDNPYQRSFSESERFDDTVFEKLTYALNNTLLTDLYINSVQPSPEEGIYFETRYQINKYLLLNRAYLDIWKRKADGRVGYRFESKFDFKPVNGLTFRFRYKNQLKKYNNELDRGRSITNEAEIGTIFNLSGFDRISLTYTYGQTLQPPYLSILSNPAEPGGADMAQAETLSQGDAISFDYTHVFNDKLKLNGSFMLWSARGATFWDFEDVELDFDQSDYGMKYWFNIQSRISDNLYLTLKYKEKIFRTLESEYRDYNDIPENGEYYFSRVEKRNTTIRMQLDWNF